MNNVTVQAQTNYLIFWCGYYLEITDNLDKYKVLFNNQIKAKQKNLYVFKEKFQT